MNDSLKAKNKKKILRAIERARGHGLRGGFCCGTNTVVALSPLDEWLSFVKLVSGDRLRATTDTGETVALERTDTEYRGSVSESHPGRKVTKNLERDLFEDASAEVTLPTGFSLHSPSGDEVVSEN